ncbi:MAG: hypothetical protein M1826_002167, partial [Phylliscum demangeonii]
MRSCQILPLALAATAATAFVIPDPVVAEQLRVPSAPKTQLERLVSKAEAVWSDTFDQVTDSLSKACSRANELVFPAYNDDEDDVLFTHSHPHHGHGHHHHHKPNLTVYQLIHESKYTTKLAELIDEDDDLIRFLNGTDADKFTIFTPTDRAFEKLPDDEDDKPSKELIKKTLLYHVSPDFYPAKRVLLSNTIPTLHKEKHLGDFPQRLRIGLGLRGLTLNTRARVVAINIFGTNGVIHAVDEVIMLPKNVLDTLALYPSTFSTLQLALIKTGLFNGTAVSGQTGFAPSNYAWGKLGRHINAFLFSERGTKYLKALLLYHDVLNATLYSDAFYDARDDSDSTTGGHHGKFPKGYFHVELPTLLEGHSLSIDVARYGGFISIRINGFTTVSFQNGIAKDGVIHVLSDVLIPPKHLAAEDVDDEVRIQPEMPLTVEELVARLQPYVEVEVESGKGEVEAEAEDEATPLLERLHLKQRLDSFLHPSRLAFEGHGQLQVLAQNQLGLFEPAGYVSWEGTWVDGSTPAEIGAFDSRRIGGGAGGGKSVALLQTTRHQPCSVGGYPTPPVLDCSQTMVPSLNP